ncbi:MAG: glycerophosphodiester phosphodiesterase [Candidatus Saccharimonadaceae bacterium]
MQLRNLLFVTLFVICIQLQAQTKVIAHRGFWKTEGSTQNSLTSLLKADSIKTYGSEVDVWLSSDGIPVVFHDHEVVMNEKKLVIQDSPALILSKVELQNGETLPTFENYLNTFEKCKHTKLIIEFKTHKTKPQEDKLIEKVLKMVLDRNLQDRVEYISFGLNFVTKTIHLNPMAKVYYLNGDLTPKVMKEIGASGIDYHFSVIDKNPDWVKLSHELGLKVNVWTVNKPEDIQRMIDLKVDYITTDEPLLVEGMLNNN